MDRRIRIIDTGLLFTNAPIMPAVLLSHDIIQAKGYELARCFSAVLPLFSSS
jgi:hypothetical protein